MAGVEKVKLHVGQVAFVRKCAIGRKNLVVFPPYDQRGRQVVAKLGLHCRIKRQVGAIGVEEIHLNLAIARTVEQSLVVDPIVW